VKPDEEESSEPASSDNTLNSLTPALRRLGRRVVTDDLGPKIPITREELDAIEAYLKADLRELFASKTPRGSREDI
jgi:hypothetical protein